MYSIASWSPRYSLPFTVSYMCQCQLSGLTLPSAAFTPPCAATVCERVGKTLDTTATVASAWDNCSAARKPPPPAPITSVSKRRRGTACFISITRPRDHLHHPHPHRQQRGRDRDEH